MREFLHADDLASASLHLLANYDGDVALNVGTGVDVSIKELAETVAQTVGFEGELLWDSSKPDGTPRKLLDTTLISRLGWQPSIPLGSGVAKTYSWFIGSPL